MSSQVNSPLNSPALQSLTPSESSVKASSSCSKKVSKAARHLLVAIACYALAVVCYAFTGSQILLAIIAGVSLSLLLSAVCALAFAAKAPQPQVEQQGEAKGPGGLPEEPKDPSFPDPEVPTQDPDLPPVPLQAAIPLGASKPENESGSDSQLESKPESKPEQEPEKAAAPTSAPVVSSSEDVSTNKEADSGSDDEIASDSDNEWEPACPSFLGRLFG